MKLTILDKYLSGRLLYTLLRSLVALVALFVIIDLLTQRREQIMRLDIPWTVVTLFYLAHIPWIVFQVAPLAILVAALMVLGETAQANEVTAALAGGISLRRFSRMPLLLGLVFALGLFVAQETVGTVAAERATRIERDHFSWNPDAERAGLTWARLSGGWTCHVLKFNRVALSGENVLMNAIREDAIEHIKARRIYWHEEREQWLIEDGHRLIFTPDGREIVAQERITQAAAPIEEHPDLLFAIDKPPETQTIFGLSAVIRHAARIGVPAQRLLVDYHVKFSQPAIAFVMMWLAIPFALRVRRGGVAIGFGASIAIALAYLTVFGISIALGNAGRMPPFLAAWLANFVFLATGVTLFLKTPT